MTSKSSLTAAIISRAESYSGIRGGIVSLGDLLKGPSYEATQHRLESTPLLSNLRGFDRPINTLTLLVLGLHHPRNDPQLDTWEKGDSWGNRRLREISELLKQWLQEQYDVGCLPLPYHVEKGGIFLKDAAALCGIGIIGRNNLLLNPEWGPRIRLRAILLEGQFQTTPSLEGFSPCETCEVFCQNACPRSAFPLGDYSRPICLTQMNADEKSKSPKGETRGNGKRNAVINYCRACELSCPVGT
jgi:epoxyqueuosine reductase